MSPAEFKRFLRQGAAHAGPGSRLAKLAATFGKKVKPTPVGNPMLSRESTSSAAKRKHREMVAKKMPKRGGKMYVPEKGGGGAWFHSDTGKPTKKNK